MRRFFSIRLSIFLRQSRWGFALLALWFTVGTIAFHYWDHLPLSEAVLSAVYLGVHAGPLWELYSMQSVPCSPYCRRSSHGKSYSEARSASGPTLFACGIGLLRYSRRCCSPKIMAHSCTPHIDPGSCGTLLSAEVEPHCRNDLPPDQSGFLRPFLLFSVGLRIGRVWQSLLRLSDSDLYPGAGFSICMVCPSVG
jgi:hypothetical protein